MCKKVGRYSQSGERLEWPRIEFSRPFTCFLLLLHNDSVDDDAIDVDGVNDKGDDRDDFKKL